jgi:hypothetical protein
MIVEVESSFGFDVGMYVYIYIYIYMYVYICVDVKHLFIASVFSWHASFMSFFVVLFMNEALLVYTVSTYIYTHV